MQVQYNHIEVLALRVIEFFLIIALVYFSDWDCIPADGFVTIVCGGLVIPHTSELGSHWYAIILAEQPATGSLHRTCKHNSYLSSIMNAFPLAWL